MDLEKMPKVEMIALLVEYDKYLEEAREQEKFADGWIPVCLAEFYDEEFQLFKEELERGN